MMALIITSEESVVIHIPAVSISSGDGLPVYKIFLMVLVIVKHTTTTQWNLSTSSTPTILTSMVLYCSVEFLYAIPLNYVGGRHTELFDMIQKQ